MKILGSLILYVLCLSTRKTVASKATGLSNWENSTDPLKYEMVLRFMNYALAYNEVDIKDERRFCSLNDDTNSTASVIEGMLKSCVNRDYFPRILSSKQVSLKKVKSNEEVSKDQDVSEKRHSRGNRKPQQDSVKSDGDESIHKYLAFALVLPKHPFSRQLIDSLHTVAPLFPHITVYFGIGYEYQELCSQYGVRSFPKLLFFHNGLLTNKYGKSRDPETVAYHFAKWTQSLPEALPVSRRSSRTLRRGIFSNYNSTSYFPVSNESHWVVKTADTWLVKASAGRSVEPLITLSPVAVNWDFEIFLFSGCYVMLRFAYSVIVSKKEGHHRVSASVE